MKYEKQLIIAIGSSAGGVNTLSEFLSKIDTNIDATYIIVQHLSATILSQLASILQMRSSLPIVTVENGMKIESQKVYLAPPSKNLTLKNGFFILKDIDGLQTSRPSITQLFNSVALEYQERAVGILLTGLGYDGADGLKKIKEYGGWTFAQDPALAAYSQMPQHAVDMSVVDFVLSIRDIPSYISEIAYEPQELLKELHSEEYINIIDFLTQTQNTKFSNYKKTTIKRRIKNRISALGLQTATQYLHRLHNDPNEVKQLIKNLLINVTNFFRDAESFDALRRYVEDFIFAKKLDAPIRIWVTGCSTGEEAYSIAIILNEILDETFDTRDIKIFATDIDTEVIEKARLGIYSKDKVGAIPLHILEKYFFQVENGYKVVKSIRNKIIFGVNDLTSSAPIAKVDLITCRNVLIYFDKELQKKILRLFHYALNKKGMLFLGKSESNLLVPDLFQPLDTHNKIYQKINMNIALSARNRDGFSSEEVEQETLCSAFEYNQISYFFETILQNSNDAIIAINTENQITSINQTALDTFNLDKEMTLNFPLDEVLHGLMNQEISSDIERTIKTHEKIIRNIHQYTNSFGEEFYCHITFIPFSNNKTQVEQVILIIRNITMQIHLKKQIVNLKQKNQEQLNQLNMLNEELQVTNEELETVNEELQATNEELETTNEELQAMNEELQSSNDDLQMNSDALAVKNTTLQTSKTSLEKLVNDKVEQIRKQDKLLIQQSKLAAMGEMVGAIAHQWRQPLNELGLSIQNLKYDYKRDKIDEVFIENFIEYNKNIIMFMSHTIDNFRNFFKIDKEKNHFFIKRTINSVVNLVAVQLQKNHISISVKGEDITYFGYENEFAQVILNIINNAKDALIEQEVENKKIEIFIEGKHIIIKDNAKGIDSSIIDRIFEPYFSTKKDKNGTGIGLYMSKVIIEDNMKGKIEVENIKDGVMFSILLG